MTFPLLGRSRRSRTPDALLGSLRDRDLGELDPTWTGAQMQVLETPAGPVRALVAGPEDGPVHLLIHGLGASAASWVDAVAGLGRRGHRAIAPDLPGFGTTPPFGMSPLAVHGATIGRLTSFVVDVANSLDTERVVLHGNSLGGLLAVRAHPHITPRVCAVLLASPALPVSANNAFPISWPMLLAFGLTAVPLVGEVAMMVAARSGEPFDQSMIDAAFVDIERLTSPAMDALYADEVASFRTEAWRRRAMLGATRSILPRIALGPLGWNEILDDEAPVSVLWGTRDGLLPRGILTEIRARRPDWRILELPEAGHAPQFDQPTRYVDEAIGLVCRAAHPSRSRQPG